MDKLRIIVRESSTRVQIREKTSRVEVRQIGPRGLDGLSAYEVWLSQGNTGTEQDFFDSIGNSGLTKEEADTYYSQLGHTHTVAEITDFDTATQTLIDNTVNPLEQQINTSIEVLNTSITEETNRAVLAEQNLQTQITNLTGVDNAYDVRLDNLELGLQTTDSNLAGEIARATTAESQLENSITALSTKEQTDIDNLQSQIDGIVQVNNNQNSSIDSINATITDIYNDINTLNNKNIEQDSRLDGIDTSITDLQGQIDSVVSVNNTQDGQISNLQSQINALTGVDGDYDVRLDNLELGLTEVQNKNAEQDTRLDSLDTSIIGINTQLVSIESKNLEQDSRLDNIETELATKANAGDNSDITSLSGITGGISTVDYIDFNQLPINDIQEARVRWNETDGTLEIGLKGGNVVLQVGQESVTMVQNNTGSDLFEGQVVYLQGSTGNNLNILLAQANSEQKSSKTFGVLTENINHNNKGYVTTSGLVRNINTSALIQGQAIWLDPLVPGGLTSIKPVAPNHLVLVGWCVRQHETVGSIFVHVQNGYELEELHNVLITALQNGDILSYNATTGLWENKQVDFSAIETDIANLQTEINQVETNLANEITRATTAENNIVQDLIANYMPITRTFTLEELTDVSLQNLEDGKILKYNGQYWVADNSTVAVQETFTATEGQLQFILENQTFGSSVLTVNGIQIAYNIDYTTTGNVLTFAYPLQEGDYVIITYGITYTSFPLDNSITAGVQTRAPSQEAVYNALLLKSNVGHTHTTSNITDYTTTTQTLIDNTASQLETQFGGEINTLTQSLNDEVLRATTVEQNLQTQITNLTGVDNAYDVRLDDLELGLTTTNTNLTNEISRATTAESGLQTQIDTINTNLSNKADIGHTHTVSDITDYTTATQSLIDTKATELETIFGGEIDTLTQSLNDEVLRATTAEQGLQSQVDVINSLDLTQNSRLNTIDTEIDTINASLLNKADINHTHSLNDLTDVSLSANQDKDTLFFDINTNSWINRNIVIDDITGLASGEDTFMIITAQTSTTTNEHYGYKLNYTTPIEATFNIEGIRTTMTGGSSATPYTTTGVSHYRAHLFIPGTNQTITNQYGFYASASLTSASNNYGFYGYLNSSIGRWNFYANGTAPNYMAGDVRTNTTFTKNTNVVNSNITAIATASSLIGGIRTGSPTVDITLTLPTGTNMDSAFQELQTNHSFEWSYINLSGSNNCSIVSNTNHTIVGSDIIYAGTSVRFLTRKISANTFITYRIS